jgi:hypothetical protein
MIQGYSPWRERRCDGNFGDFPFSIINPAFAFVSNLAMSVFRNSASSSIPYKDGTPLPDSVPKVQELGVTSAPLKSAAFFIAAYCKEYNGASVKLGDVTVVRCH